MNKINDPDLIKVVIIAELEPSPTGRQEFLFVYDKKLPMTDNIRKIIIQHNKTALEPLAVNGVYALKVTPSKKHQTEHFITEQTIEEDVLDGTFIKLVPSVQATVKILFEKNMNSQWLYFLSHDLVFIREIVDQNRQNDLIDLIQTGQLNDDGESGALNILYHLLKNGYLRNLSDSLMSRVVGISETDSHSSEFALSLIIFILKSKKDSLASNRNIIMERLKVPIIMKNFGVNKSETDIQFYTKVFFLINSMISCARAERRKAILVELNSQENHKLIYTFLVAHKDLDGVLAREVFVLQARLLTNTYFGLYTNRSTITASILYEDTNENRNSTCSDYDYLEPANRNTLQDGAWVSNLQKAESMCSILSVSSMNKTGGSPLLHKCLEYGKSYYHTYFDSLEKSDYSCDAELYTISQNVISILTNLLCIGITVHAHNYYLPMFFDTTPIQTYKGMRVVSFFEELFVKTLMLLFRTKSEMRVKTQEDFKKLYQVLKKQLKLIFEKHPKDFEQYDKEITEVKYTNLQEILQQERDARWTNIYTKNPCVLELIEGFTAKNTEVIMLARYRVLQKGFVFRNMTTKGKYFSLTLNPDYKSLLYVECEKNGAHLADGHKLCLPVTSIKHVIYGEKSNLRSNSLVQPIYTECVFTIVYYLDDSCETSSIDCFFNKDTPEAKKDLEVLQEMTELTTLWKEGLNFLMGKPNTSTQMMKELDELNELDCKMQLIELQDIEIPMNPPPVPKFELY